MGQDIHSLRAVATLDPRPFLEGMRQVISALRDLNETAARYVEGFAAHMRKSGDASTGAASTVSRSSDQMADAVEDAAGRVEDAGEKTKRTFHDVRDAAGRFSSARVDLSGLTGSLESFRGHAGRFLSDLSAMASRATLIVTGMATATVAAVTTMGFQFLSLKEQSLVAFETMLGSAERARSFLGDLQAFAAATPFEFPGLISSAQKLLAMGFAAEDVLPMLTRIGDATAALGGSPELLNRITTVLGQMKQKGKVQAEEMLQLAESGIPAWDMLAKKLGVDIPTAMKMVTDGAVSADVAINALLDGMNSKFGGLMAKQSASFGGMLSTMMDNARSAAAHIVEPMFQAVRDVMGDLMGGGDLQELATVMETIREQAADAAKALRDFVRENKPEIVRNFANAVRDTVNAGIQLMQWLREVGPPLWDFAQKIMNIVMAIAEWVAQTPYIRELFAVLAFAQLTGTLGILTSFVGMVSSLLTGLTALLPVVTAVVSSIGTGLTAAAGAATTAVGALTLGFGALIAVGVTAWLVSVRAELQKMNEELKESLALSNRMAEKGVKDRESRVDEAAKKGLEAKVKQLERERADAERHRVIARAQLAAAEKHLAEQEGKGVLGWIAGADVKGAKDAVESKKKDLALRDADFRNTEKQLASERAKLAAQSAIPVNPGADFEAAAMAGQVAVGAVPAAGPMNEAAGAVNTVTVAVKDLKAAAKDAEQAAKDAEAAEAKRQEEAAARVLPARHLGQDILDLKSKTTDASYGAMESRFLALQSGAAEGSLTQQQWQAGMQQVNTAQNAATRFSDGMGAAEQQLIPGAQLDPLRVEALNLQFDQLMQSFLNNQIGAERFNEEMGKLSQATAQAADEANKAALAKQREAALKPFAGLLAKAGNAPPEVRQALEDRLLSMQKQRFSQQIDGMVNGFLRMNGVVGQTTDALQQMPGQLHDFGSQLQMGSQVSMDQAREGFNNFFSWMNTTGGQIASIQNQIQFAYQRLSVVRGKDNRLASQILEQINSMTAEINRLLTPQTPLFSDVNQAQVSVDPGLQTKSSVSIEFPNVTRMTNEDISKMADRIQYELRRRGRPA